MRLVYLFIITVFIISSLSYSNDYIDNNRKYLSILDIAHYNDDNSLDTLYGVGLNFAIFPRYIHWGNDTNRTTSIPQHLLVEKSKIIYPDFVDINVAGFSNNMNYDDVKDISLFVWGKTDTSSTANDTILSYCLFGQNGLDTLDEIDLTLVDSMSVTPFVAMNLRIGTDITDLDVRDFTEFPSFKVNKSNTSTEPPPGSFHTDIPLENNIIVKLYPNPATYYTNLEINSLQPGEIQFSLMNMDAKEIMSKAIVLKENETILERIDLQNIPIGTYILSLRLQNNTIQSYKLIVIK